MIAPACVCGVGGNLSSAWRREGTPGPLLQLTGPRTFHVEDRTLYMLQQVPRPRPHLAAGGDLVPFPMKAGTPVPLVEGGTRSSAVRDLDLNRHMEQTQCPLSEEWDPRPFGRGRRPRTCSSKCQDPWPFWRREETLRGLQWGPGSQRLTEGGDRSPIRGGRDSGPSCSRERPCTRSSGD